MEAGTTPGGSAGNGRPGAHQNAAGRSAARLLLPYLPMLAVWVILCVGFWPGHMNADSLFETDQAAGLLPINDQHSPILIWLWSLVWPLGAGPWFPFVLEVGAFLGGAYLIARAAFGRLGSSLLAAGVAVWPAVFGNLALTGRDMWFAAFLLLAFGFAVDATRRTGRRRQLSLTAGVVAAFFCLASRQNAAAAVAIALIAIAAIAVAPRLRGARRLDRWGIPLVFGVVATLVIVGAQIGVTRLAGVDRTRPEQYLYVYDLAAMSQREGESLFPRSVYPSGDLATLEQTSNIDTIAGLVFGTSAPIPLPRSPEQVAELKSAWLDEVKANPFGYLGMRTDAWLHQIGLTQDPIWIYHPVIDPNERGWHLAFPALDDAFGDYQDLFADQYNNGGILNRAWIYLLLAIPAAFLLLRRSPALMVVGGLALSAWTYQVGLFFGTMGSQYRFEFPVVASVILAVAVAVKALVDERRGRTASDPVSEGLAPPRPAALPTATGSG